jgi:glucose/arabinose dehydrogenase
VSPDHSSRGRLRRDVVRVLLAAFSLAALIGSAAPSPAQAALPLTQVGSGFARPIYVTHAGDNRLFVVEQGGSIKIIGGGTFLDLSGLITSAGSEQGLLGLAFHPNYASNGLLYVNYTRKSDGRTVIAEYKRSSGNANTANPASARVVLTIAQPYANHNGGWMGFKGKLLYIATGDGGSGGDPGNRAQSKNSLLGKILRINPLKSGTKAYTVPPKNPFVGRTGLNEIWSYGLRNPWRCSFDRSLGRMWCADVGQAKWEEVNRHKTGKGINYGWRVMEGNDCFNPASGCNTTGKRKPIAVYSHAGGNCAITGGYVSRRSGAALNGKYVFGDYCSGRVWAIPAGHTGGLTSNHLLADTDYLVSSFGEGKDGRLYLVDYGGGRIFRLNDS